MTLDEAIKHAEEVAELNEGQARVYKEQGDTMGSWSYEECAKEHRQLADWLKELKGLREDEGVKDVFKNCHTCKHVELKPDDYPCDRCMHRYINQYKYDNTREVNANEDSN